MLFRHISKDRTCPQCHSAEVFRVRRTGMALKLVCNLANLRPHWCSTCDTFFLAPRKEHNARVGEDVALTERKASTTNPAEHGHLAH